MAFLPEHFGHYRFFQLHRKQTKLERGTLMLLSLANSDENLSVGHPPV
jgi:hypothetical protein